MIILYVGIDLAKNVFALHGVDEADQLALARPSVARFKWLDLVCSPEALHDRHGGLLKGALLGGEAGSRFCSRRKDDQGVRRIVLRVIGGGWDVAHPHRSTSGAIDLANWRSSFCS